MVTSSLVQDWTDGGHPHCLTRPSVTKTTPGVYNEQSPAFLKLPPRPAGSWSSVCGAGVSHMAASAAGQRRALALGFMARRPANPSLLLKVRRYPPERGHTQVTERKFSCESI